MRAILRVRTRPPLAHGGHRQVVAACQHRARLAGGLQLGPNQRRHSGLLVYGCLGAGRAPGLCVCLGVPGPDRRDQLLAESTGSDQSITALRNMITRDLTFHHVYAMTMNYGCNQRSLDASFLSN